VQRVSIDEVRSRWVAEWELPVPFYPPQRSGGDHCAGHTRHSIRWVGNFNSEIAVQM